MIGEPSFCANEAGDDSKISVILERRHLEAKMVATKYKNCTSVL